ETAAINVGGRLVAFDQRGAVERIERAARRVADHLGIDLRLGEVLAWADRQRLADALADCLFEAIERSPTPGELTRELMLTPPLSAEAVVEQMTFSGGVSEYLYERESGDFGDLALQLATAIRTLIDRHGLLAELQPAAERIRATVIGASQFTVQV